MKRKARSTKMTATALTSPAPARVSVCGAGANQTPFVAIKSEGVTLAEKKDLPPMIQSLKSQGFDIVSFAFKGANWTADAVKAWMADGGYDGFDVEGVDGDLTVKSATPADWMADAEKREISTDDGVTVTVGKMPAEEAPAEAAAEAIENASEVQPVATDKSEDVTDAAPEVPDAEAPEAVEAPAAEDEPEAPAAEAAADTPEVADKADAEDASVSPPEATETVVDAAASADLIGALKAVGFGGEGEVALKGLWEVSRTAELVQSLKWLVNDLDYEKAWGSVEVNAAREEAMQSVKAAAVSMLSAFKVLVEAEVAEMAEVIASKSETVAEEPSMDDKIAHAVEKALKAFLDGGAQIQASVAAEPDAAVAAEKSAGVQTPADEPARQARKSEDVEGSEVPSNPTAPAQNEASRSVAALRLRGGLGL